MKINSPLVFQSVFYVLALFENYLENEIQFEWLRYFGVHRKYQGMDKLMVE